MSANESSPSSRIWNSMYLFAVGMKFARTALIIYSNRHSKILMPLNSTRNAWIKNAIYFSVSMITKSMSHLRLLSKTKMHSARKFWWSIIRFAKTFRVMRSMMIIWRKSKIWSTNWQAMRPVKRIRRFFGVKSNNSRETQRTLLRSRIQKLTRQIKPSSFKVLSISIRKTLIIC